MLKQAKQLKTYKIHINMPTMVKNPYMLPSEMRSQILVHLLNLPPRRIIFCWFSTGTKSRIKLSLPSCIRKM